MEDNAPIIGITGATGNIGRMVASLLSDTGGLRLLVRTPAKLDPELADVAQVRATQYADDPSTVEALEGVDVLFMVSATESPDRVEVHRAFVDAAKKAGVEHIVYTSFLEASPDAVFTYARDHWHTEEHIKASGMDWTFLRDSLYLEFFAELGDSGEIRGPAAGGRCAAIARTDVARSAAAVLADPAAHASQTYNLTGPDERLRAGLRGGDRPEGPVRRRNRRRSVRIARFVRRPRMGGRRLGQHLHGDRRRRARHRLRFRGIPHGTQTRGFP